MPYIKGHDFAFTATGVADPIGQGTLIDSGQVSINSVTDGELLFVVALHNGTHTLDLETVFKALVAQMSAEVNHVVLQPKQQWLALLQESTRNIFEEFSEYVPEMVALLRHEKEVYLFGVTGGQVCLVRQGVLGSVFKVGPQPAAVKGLVAPADVIVLGNQAFYQKVSTARLEGLLISDERETDINQAAEALAVDIAQTRSESAAVGMIALLGEHSPQASLSTDNQIEAVDASPKTSWRQRWTRLRDSVVYVQVDEGYSRRQKFGGIVFTILLVLLLTSVGIGWRRRLSLERQQAFESVFQPARDQLSSARRTAAVNRLGALDQISQVRSNLQTVLPSFEKDSEYQSQLQELAAEVEEVYVQLSGFNQVTPELFLDLSLVVSDFFGNRLALSEDRLLVIDSASGKLMSVGADTKQASLIAAGGEISGSQLLGVNTDFGLLFNSSGIISVDLGNGQTQVIVPYEEEWGEIVSLAGFGSNAYIVDATFGDIWRYRPAEGEWSRTRWLAPGITPDFSGVVDLMIDGDIWVLSDSGQTLRQYTQGVPQGVELIGLPEPLKQPKAVSIGGNIYIFDASANRVVEFSRDGTYLRQFAWNDFEMINDMVVYQDKILLLGQGKIYQVGL